SFCVCAPLFHCVQPFFVSLLPRPPRSPLFPYTTLFRSRADGRDVHDRAARLDRAHAGEGELLQVLVGAAEVGVVRLEHEHLGAVDRKSTRLNSSHVKISYAVFCLKKKKIKNKGRASSTK